MKIELCALFGKITGNVQTPANISGSSNVPGNQVVDARNINNASVTANWTGTLVGSIYVQASNDQVNWYDLGTIAVTTGNGSGRLALTDIPDQYLQAIFEPSAPGTGTLLALCNTKGF